MRSIFSVLACASVFNASFLVQAADPSVLAAEAFVDFSSSSSVAPVVSTSSIGMNLYNAYSEDSALSRHMLGM